MMVLITSTKDKTNCSILLIVRERKLARDILVVPHIILIEQFINKHVKREVEIKVKSRGIEKITFGYGDNGTCIIDKRDLLKNPDQALTDEVIQCLEISLNNRIIKPGDFEAPINHKMFNNLAAREYILEPGDRIPIINPYNSNIFDFKFEVRVIELNGANEVFKQLSDKTFTQEHIVAIQNEFNIIRDKVMERESIITQLNTEKTNLENEIQQLKEDLKNCEKELNNLNLSNTKKLDSLTIKTLQKERNEWLGIMSDLQKELERKNSEIRIKEEGIEQKIINLRQEIEAIKMSRCFICKHIQPAKG